LDFRVSAAGVTPSACWGKLGPVNKDAHYPQSPWLAPVNRVVPALSGLVLAGLLLAGLVLASLLAGCTTQPGRSGGHAGGHRMGSALGIDHNDSPRLSGQANEVLIRAIGLVGTPYRYGGNTPAGGFDCSGLVAYVFQQATGVQLPRSTRELVAYPARRVDQDDLQPGDLVFFNPSGGQASHIGIFVGEGRFVHAPSSGGTVRLDALSADYWRRAYAGARRILQ